MEKYLTILEVSQKQAYIFASRQLKENAARSADIQYVTDSAFFTRVAGTRYLEAQNLVYSGGGHTVLQFDSQEQAKDFARVVTETVLRLYPGLELFVKTLRYDEAKSPGENLKELSKALEQKKATRTASFRRLDFGLELPAPADAAPDRPDLQGLNPPNGFHFPNRFDQLVQALPGDTAENFLAVVHIDGNAMGTRVDDIYKANSDDWEHCRTSLQQFSQGIQADFETAFQETVDEVIRILQPEHDLPIRPVILAGDDVCFVTAGRIGLECARIFLQKLAAHTNPEQPGRPYAACAGVALVHLKYPFHRAYDLAEELCSSAKRFGAALDPEGRISAMDWHIEFGQLKDSLSALREDYRTEDGCRLELRPAAVLVPDGLPKPAPERFYNYFRTLCGVMQNKQKLIARSKIKQLRTALKQGEVEAEFFLRDREISQLLYEPLQAAYPLQDWPEVLRQKGAFRAFPEKDGSVRRCLFFDAIELLDHYQTLEEVSL